MATLLCTVRGCRAPLRREGGSFVCTAGHLFNVARSGYVNLLQPQDRRSREPGDASETVRARRRFLDAGHDDPFLADLLALAGKLGAGPGAEVLDVGCGEGRFLGRLTGELGARGSGIDLSITACDLAARRHPSCLFVVANADRFLPYADGSFQLVTSLAGPRNPAEMRRALSPGGRLLLAIPAPDDLAELRETLLGEAPDRERAARIEADFAAGFELLSRGECRHTALLPPEAIRDLALATYRLGRPSRLERLASVGEMEVTMSRRTLIFSPR